MRNSANLNCLYVLIYFLSVFILPFCYTIYDFVLYHNKKQNDMMIIHIEISLESSFGEFCCVGGFFSLFSF